MMPISSIKPRYIALGLFTLWLGALLLFGLIHSDVFGLEEAAAKNLILIWSLVDQIASPVGYYGAPDLRALLLFPAGLYWSGSILAAKVLTSIIFFYSAILLYNVYKTEENEAIIIGISLLLISPILITQIDAVGSGPFLLLSFALAHLADKRYRSASHHLNGWFFIQILMIALAVSLHPMGLAYPIALVWIWWQEHDNPAAKKAVIMSAVITTMVILVFRNGWPDLQNWLINPVQSLSDATMNGMSGLENKANIGVGVLLFCLLGYIVAKDWKNTFSTLTGRTMVFGVIIGLLYADAGWAMITLTLLLIRGIPLLIQANDSFKAQHAVAQRGAVIAGVFVIATLFMLSNKTYVQQKNLELLAPVDSVIRTVCAEAADPDKPFKAASQWPARTLMACRRDVLPLPPSFPSGRELIASMKGFTHIAFDHSIEKNKGLVDNMSELSGLTETLSLQKAGVVVYFKPIKEVVPSEQPKKPNLEPESIAPQSM